MPVLLQKARVFWPLLLLLVLADCATKRWAEAHLTGQTSEPVAGDVVRWTLAYNQVGAMGLHIGSATRPVFVLATIIALIVLARLYYTAGARDKGLAAATALIMGGALGNLIDRVRWNGGVIDFIDIGIGTFRFWVFNVADMGVTTGAALLGWLMWRQEKRASSLPPARITR